MDDWYIGDSRFRRAPRVKRTRLERVLLWAALPLGLAFFFAGYRWQSDALSKADAGIDNLAHSPARQAALDAIDEAVRAKYEKRTAGILSALDRARRTDPKVPGLDNVYAETALNERKFIEMRVAANAAKKKGGHTAGAAVLLGMDKWLSRGPTDREMSAAADAASGYFAEATETDFFAAPAWFFWGDILRYAGREAEGHRQTFGALRRFNPWDSSDVIAAKIIFASAEAGDNVFIGLTFLPDSPWVRALGNAANASEAGARSLRPLAPFAAQSTLRALAPDRFFGSIQQRGGGTVMPLLHRKDDF